MGRRSLVVFLAASAASCSLFTSPSEGRSGPCPSGMAFITTDDSRARSFCIDKWEGAVVELRGKREVNHSPYEPVTNLKVKAVSRAGVVPQGYISRNEAEAACKAARKRLCTGEEWLLACRGKKPTTFPYGDERKSGHCNDSGRAPIAALHPELGDGVYASHEAMNDARINKAPNTVAKTGAFSKCKNAFGVFDMVGNLHEWTADVNGTRGVFRGGYYQDTHLNGDGCKYKTVAHDVNYHDYSTGFRCCSDAR
ncbi:MAG TPA: SUMF1/EgtB/PvdO family nonheme iron enzyme [Labilithrix sp.]|nr:SUMF1/EgtB/PvdO family nonheme iron enzyme [Labilithrix sp.]